MLIDTVDQHFCRFEVVPICEALTSLGPEPPRAPCTQRTPNAVRAGGRGLRAVTVDQVRQHRQHWRLRRKQDPRESGLPSSRQGTGQPGSSSTSLSTRPQRWPNPSGRASTKPGRFTNNLKKGLYAVKSGIEGSSDSSTVIECSAVTVERGEFRLGPIDLTIARGTTILLGRNGAGKTTFLRSIVGLEALASGAIRVRGIGTTDRRARRDLMRRVGFAPQEAAIPHAARVADTVAYAAWLKGVPHSATRERVQESLEILDIGSLALRHIRDLSGGERQRVSIAMALVHRPDVLLLDEPSAGLDPIQRVSLRRLLDGIASDRAVVLSTHLVEEVGGGRESVVVLKDGAIAFNGSAAQLEDHSGDSAAGNSALERGIWSVLGGEDRS